MSPLGNAGSSQFNNMQLGAEATIFTLRGANWGATMQKNTINAVPWAFFSNLNLFQVPANSMLNSKIEIKVVSLCWLYTNFETRSCHSFICFHWFPIEWNFLIQKQLMMFIQNFGLKPEMIELLLLISDVFSLKRTLMPANHNA